MPAESTSEAVGDAAKAAVDAVGILKPGVTPGAPVPCVKRKTPGLPEGREPPEIVVSVSEETETERLTAAHKMRTIRFAVTIVTAGGAKAADDATVRKWRDQIDGAIFDKQLTAFAGVAGFVHLRAFGGRVFDPSALSRDFNYSTLSYEARVAEALAP